MSGKLPSLYTGGIRIKSPSSALLAKIRKIIQENDGKHAFQIQDLVFKATGEKIFDVIPPTEDYKEKAVAIGTQLCAIEAQQDQARRNTAELRRRYLRDCALYKIEPITSSEGTTSPVPAPASDPDASSTEHASVIDSSTHSSVTKSEPCTPQ
jgi:cell pole-organizing protein PopZ